MCAGVSTCVQTDGGTHGHIHTRTHTHTESGCEVDGHRQTQLVCVCERVYFSPLCTKVRGLNGNLVDPASSHTLVSKIKPCMSKYKRLYSETANGSLYQL